MPAPFSISADEVNYLIYRYLLESGFRHTVFAFENESQITKKLDDFRNCDVRPGHLISLLHKAMQLMLVEMHMDEDGTERDCEATLSLLMPHNCIIPHPSDAADKRHRKASHGARKQAQGTPIEPDSANRRDKLNRKRLKERQQRRSESGPVSKRQIASDPDVMDVDESQELISSSDPQDVIVQVQTQNGDDSSATITEPIVTLQTPHAHFYVSAWNPAHPNLLASGSLDSIVALWSLPSSSGRINDATLIKHPSELRDNEVTCLVWSPNGEFLATGTKDAKTRIFTRKGAHVLTFSHSVTGSQCNPVFALGFNPDSRLLASGCANGTIIVWDIGQDSETYSSSAHTGAVMAFDWYDNHILASGASDSTIRLSDVKKGSQTCWSGHASDINDIKWDPTHKFLASCSDDSTIAIWSREHGGPDPLAVLKGHTQPVLTIDWNPKPPNGVPQLASASIDSTIRIWDILTGACIFTLNRYVKMHCVLSYSPCGKYLASGSDDQFLYVWTTSSQLVKTFYGHGDILDLRFNSTGDLAVCFGTSKLAILNI